MAALGASCPLVLVLYGNSSNDSIMSVSVVISAKRDGTAAPLESGIGQMTAQDKSGYDADRQAGAEIEITEEMIRVGLVAYRRWETEMMECSGASAALDIDASALVKDIILASRKLGSEICHEERAKISTETLYFLGL